jgi:hypothetical protein
VGRGVLRALLIVALALLLPGLLDASLGPTGGEPNDPRNKRIEQSYQYIKAHLEAPFEGYGDPPGVAVAGWKIAALSHMATGLMSMSIDAAESGDQERQAELGRLLQEVAARATTEALSPYDRPLAEIDNFDDWGFYLGHLSITLGCARHVSGDTRYDALHGRIVRYQLTRMTDDGDFHGRSYPNSYKWPADQALTLAGASLYDRIHGTELAVEPTAGWLSEMDRLSRDGLHPFALSVATALPIDGENLLPPLPSADIPRGSALSPTVFYLAQLDPEAAAALYRDYRRQRLDSVLGFGGFREWPGAGGSDIEAGPVLLGLGSIATALGLAPARIFGDETAYTTIVRSALVAGVPNDLGPGRGHLLAPLLGEAILFHGLTARAWFDPPPPVDFQDSPPPAVGAWLLLLLDLILLALLLRPLLRLAAQHRQKPVAEEMSGEVIAPKTHTPEPLTRHQTG